MKILHQMFISIAIVWTLILFMNFELQYIWYILLSFICIAQLSSFYHRCLSHQMWKCSNWLQHVLLFINAGFLAGHAAIWVAIHIKHHRFSDTQKDPHGPKAGLLNTLNNSYYKFDNRQLNVLLKKNKPMRAQFKYYYIAPVLMCLSLSLIDYAIWPIITTFMWLSIIITNYVCHWNGHPRNIPSLFFITGGDSYHLNHHQSKDFRFGKYDPGYFISKLLAKL